MGIDICPEMSQNFIDYAYEVNLSRAFPDSRDGLKPVQRCALWEMYNSGYTSKKPHVKAAKVSGATIAFWHPHSSTAVYEAFGRMSQDWVENIVETDWHGNNGNISIGQELGAERYCEVRLSKMSEDGFFKGLEKKNVPFELNFSEDMEMPSVFPAIFPRLLVNGAMGIGVSIATIILPHNLKEVSDAIINYIRTGEVNTSSFYPDFPTAGVIVNKDELESIYTTGKGKVVLRSKTEIKDNKIIVTELPYQIYVEPVKEKIIELVDKGKLSGIIDVVNKTSKNGLLVEIEIERGYNPEEVLEQLYEMTDLQKTFNANQMALVGKTPTLLNLEEYFKIYLQHNLECLQREAQYDLNKAKNRQEIVEGLLKALENINNIIVSIKESESQSKAKESLVEKYDFTERQAQAIVDMKLGRLSRLEAIELNKELEGLIETINSINNFLSSPEAQKEKVISNLEGFTNKYGTPRKTQLTQIDLTPKKKEKIIVEEDINIALTNKNGLVRKSNAKKTSTIKDIVNIKTTENLYLFSSHGNIYKILANEITSNEINIYELLSLEDGEEIISISKIKEGQFVIGITREGRIKKSNSEEYLDLKKKKAIAMKLKEEDSIAVMRVVNPGEKFNINTNNGEMEIDEMAHLSKGRVTIGTKLSNKKDFIVIN